MTTNFRFPGQSTFAFTIIDDTDQATLDNVRPVYELLDSLGFKTTKSVWPVACPEGSIEFGQSQTLDDSSYLEYILSLQRRGFEITWHGATMESSDRARTQAALERFAQAFGHYPRIHLNHAENAENIYWGAKRLDNWLIKASYERMLKKGADAFQGEVAESKHWWGDLCQQYITYTRNLTFRGLNTIKINPSMPYSDPNRPLSKFWFSTSDAHNAPAFIKLLSTENVDRLVAEGGLCILSTHLGKRFCHNGQVRREVKERLEYIARKPGWFVPAGRLLDWLKDQRQSYELPKSELRKMELTWAMELVTAKIRSFLRREA